MQNSSASLRIVGAIIVALFLVLVVTNTMTVHRQQRELAEQRKQEFSDKMHSRRSKKQKHGSNNNHAFVQHHGMEGFDDATDEKLTTVVANSGDDIDQYFQSEIRKSQNEDNIELKKARRKKNVNLMYDDVGSDDIKADLGVDVTGSNIQRRSSRHKITPATPPPPPPLGFFESIKNFFGFGTSSSSSSTISNNNNITNSSENGGSDENDDETSFRNHHHKSKQPTFLSDSSASSSSQGMTTNNNLNLLNNVGEDDDDGGDLEQQQAQQQNVQQQLQQQRLNSGDAFQQQALADETERLKQKLEKLMEKHDDLQREMDEQNIIKKRKHKKNHGEKKKGHDNDDENENDEDDADDQAKKHGINIKINLNTGGGGNNNNRNDGEDDEDEDGHNSNNLRRNKHRRLRNKIRRHRYQNNKRSSFGAEDLIESNYQNGAAKMDNEDVQVLDQANRQLNQEMGIDDGDNANTEDTEDDFDEGDCPGFPSEDGLPFVPYQKLVEQGRIYEPKFAYVTYITSAEFALPAAVLMFSIANSGSQYARVICVSKEISERDRGLLGLFAQIIEIDKIPSPLYVENARYRDTFTKLRMWQLEMFTKALYIDTDVIVRKNIDVLFDLDEWSVPMDAEEQRYSTGMMLIAPSWKTFAAMMYDLNTTTVSMELPDLLFLKEFFERRGKGVGLKLDDVPALSSKKASSSANTGAGGGNNNNNNNAVGGSWAWRNNRWTYISGGGGGGGEAGYDYNPINSFKATKSRGAINIIPRWFQVYHIEFGSQYHSYLTHRVQKLTIYDPRIYGIHYPGNGKPWQDMGKKLKRFAKYICHPEQPEARVRWRYQPEFLWYIYYSMMKRALKKMERGIVGSPIFESERGRDIILNDYVKQQEKKRLEEEQANAYSYNSYNYNNNNYNNNNWYNNYNNNNNNYEKNANNNHYNNNKFANDDQGNNNNGNSPFSSRQQPAAECTDCPKFIPSACLSWNLTKRTPPGVVLFEEEEDGYPVGADEQQQGQQQSSDEPTTTTTTTTSAPSKTTRKGAMTREERYKQVYAKYYNSNSNKVVASSPSSSSTATTTTTLAQQKQQQQSYSWNNYATPTPSASTTTSADNTDTAIIPAQPQTFEDYILTSQARPVMDLSTLDPLVLNLPQRSGLSGKSWEKSERYTWVVSWCTRTAFRSAGDEACGRASFVAQYSNGVCRTNFHSQFSIHPFGKVPRLLAPIEEEGEVEDAQEVEPTTTTAATANKNSSALLQNISNNNNNGSSSDENNNNFNNDKITSSSTAAAATKKKIKKPTQQKPPKVYQQKDLVPEYEQEGEEGVVIRSAVELSSPKRTKYADVVVRCDWSMKSETAVDFDIEHPQFSSSNSYFAVVVDAVRQPHDRRYRIFLKSRCACAGGCGLAKLWNETYNPQSATMKLSAKDEWVRNVTGMEPSVDDLFPTTTTTTTTKATAISQKKKHRKRGGNNNNNSSSNNNSTEINSTSDFNLDEIAGNVDDDDDTVTTSSPSSSSSSNSSKNSSTSSTPNSPLSSSSDSDDSSFSSLKLSTTTTTTTTKPPPPRTTKPYENQTDDERRHVHQVLDRATEVGWSLLGQLSTLNPCLAAMNEYMCGYVGNSAFGRCQWVKEPNEKDLLGSIVNQKNESGAGSIAAGDVVTNSPIINNNGGAQQLPPSVCLPSVNQSFILIVSKSQKKRCNCTKLYSNSKEEDEINSEKQQQQAPLWASSIVSTSSSSSSMSLDECFEKAIQIGANVINYRQGEEPSVLPFEWQRLVDLESNFTKMRREQKKNPFDDDNDNVDGAPSKRRRKLENANEEEKYLSRAERMKLARKRRAEAARRAKLTPPPTTTTSTTTSFGGAFSSNNFYSSYYSQLKKAKKNICELMMCPQTSVLREKVPLQNVKNGESGYHVFVKNVFFVNSTNANKMLLL